MSKNIEDEIARLRKLSDEYNAKYRISVAVLRSKLKDCKHVFTTEYRWEHDNGYGSQHWISGKQCLSCLKVCLWSNSSNWVDLSDCTF
jgi:hypothetical protein